MIKKVCRSVNRFLALIISVTILFSGCKTNVKPPEDKDVVDAYIYLLSRYIVIRQENYDIGVEKVGYNKIKYNPLGSAQFVNPNMDVAYLEAWIAVDSNSAVILNVPAVKDRYYTAQLLDGWGEVITNINERTYPAHPSGAFALVLKGSSAAIPKGAEKVELPAGKIKILARVELKGTPKIAEDLQHQFTLDVPSGIKIDSLITIPSFTNTKLIEGDIFDKVDEVLASYPDVMPKAAEYQAAVRKVADYRNSSLEAKTLIDSIVVSKAIPKFFDGAKGFGTQKGGWSVSYVAGKFENDIMARAIIDYGGLWANSINEAIYFIGLTDSDKKLLDGSQTYEVRFPANALPGNQVNAFWSMTLYSVPDYRVVPNKINRYNLNNISGLKKNPDGSESIWLAPELPKNAPSTNWLPTPAGKPFSLNLRMYASKKQVQDGSWYPAPIQNAPGKP